MDGKVGILISEHTERPSRTHELTIQGARCYDGMYICSTQVTHINGACLVGGCVYLVCVSRWWVCLAGGCLDGGCV